jgi:hypothetical protein
MDDDEEAQNGSVTESSIHQRARGALCGKEPLGEEKARSEESDEEEEDKREEQGCASECLAFLWECILFPWYCNLKRCMRRLPRLRKMYCMVVLAGFGLAYGYIVLINDLLAHSYEVREARGLYGVGDRGIHGTPHVIEQTQRFYS